MQLNSIEEIIEDIRQGKMVILMDDEDRENEGDLIVSAQKVTPEIINFMASKARGLICLTLSGERCDFLGLPSMVASNNAKYSTPFTVSIEAAEGVTTGISAADRARTIQVAVDPNSEKDDIVQPGHIFPLRAQPGGVLSRAGHTEAGCDLARLAGLAPAAAIVEIMNEDGTMSRRPDLEVFAKEHDLKIGTIADLIQYRIMHEQTTLPVETQTVETRYGDFTLTVFEDSIEGGTHIALSKGEIKTDEPCLVRVHVAQTLRDLIGVKNNDKPGWSLGHSLRKVSEDGCGVVVLLNTNDGSDVQREVDFLLNRSPSKRNPQLDKSGTYKTIGTGSQILRHLNVGKMRLLSSPMKFGGIGGFGLEVVEYIPFTPEI
ncbi:bifunctional 3,4-dihydroxy-2-butanone-4-phosphate synthase/GTP cyclohydrolase II [Marinicellulosiphila megalodicopiae]|uniref:bifunctional 3,4-dihydroxy-2-butanone-4-phosphate synthase/GTP cyclohydrolase II n=1 Tax=Marinicellulosiphila megalodicopiae TaxID=2724896 RepID=UPI003BAE447C